MPDGFKIDTREFDAALEIYRGAVEKDHSYIANRVALNVAIKTAQATPLTNRADIRNVAKNPWWPKLIAKRLKKAKGGRRFTRAEARDYSKRVINQRLKVRGYIRSGWIPAIKRLNAAKQSAKGFRPPSARVSGVSGIRNPPGYAVEARPGVHVKAVIANSADGASKQPEHLQQGLNEAARDMIAYAHQLMSQTAAEHSAK